MKKLIRVLTILLCNGLWGHNVHAQAGVTGDRVVVTINNVPFTQRQVEGYIDLKEMMRTSEEPMTPLVDASNWEDALTTFTRDAVILLESQRVGGVLVPDSMLKKYVTAVKAKTSAQPKLAATVKRLGLEDGSLERAIDAVLRVSIFRRSRDRQTIQSQLLIPKSGSSESQMRTSVWERDLGDRAMIRRYEGADQYVLIQPTAGAQFVGPAKS